MTEALGPPGLDGITVVGMLATEEQAQEAMQMRVVLAWNLHLARARPHRGPSRSSPPM